MVQKGTGLRKWEIKAGGDDRDYIIADWPSLKNWAFDATFFLVFPFVVVFCLLMLFFLELLARKEKQPSP